MARGRHRRPRVSPNSRHLSRLSVAITAGTAGIAVPLVAAGTAQAAPVPVVQKAQPQTATTTPSAPVAKTVEAAGTATHTVVSGDTLHAIATEHEVEGGWEALYDVNESVVGGDPHLILPGQELALAADERATEQRADRSADRAAAAPEPRTYSDDLDGWIREALDVMAERGIPGTYEGIHRNVIRESGGDPNAINNWDVNAQNGTPSIGLLQVIKPTFDAYWVPGTAQSQYDPVANLVAACNYAADRYGSIDNVNGPY